MASYVWTGRFSLDCPCFASPLRSACSFERCLFLNMATDTQRANRYRHLWRTRERFRNVRRRQRAQASIVSLWMQQQGLCDGTRDLDKWACERRELIPSGLVQVIGQGFFFDLFFFPRFIRPALDVWLLNKMNSKRKVKRGGNYWWIDSLKKEGLAFF